MRRPAAAAPTATTKSTERSTFRWAPTSRCSAARPEEDAMTVERTCLILLLPLAAGCASATPFELTDAQRAYREASAGPAPSTAPDELHKARAALDQAELAFAN